MQGPPRCPLPSGGPHARGRPSWTHRARPRQPRAGRPRGHGHVNTASSTSAAGPPGSCLRSPDCSGGFPRCPRNSCGGVTSPHCPRALQTAADTPLLARHRAPSPGLPDGLPRVGLDDPRAVQVVVVGSWVARGQEAPRGGHVDLASTLRCERHGDTGVTRASRATLPPSTTPTGTVTVTPVPRSF